MPESTPKPPLEPAPEKPRTRSIVRLEATGVLVVAVLVLAIYVVRYWHHIPWSAR